MYWGGRFHLKYFANFKNNVKTACLTVQKEAWIWKEDRMNFVCIFAQEIIRHWALAAEGVSILKEWREEKKKVEWFSDWRELPLGVSSIPGDMTF